MNKTLFLGAVLIAMTGGSAGVNAENADILPTGKTYTVNGVSFTMITIPAVTDGTLGYGEYDVNPAHMVSLPAYRIGGIDTDIYNAALPVRLFYTPDFHAGSLGLCLACRLSFLHLSNRLSYRNKKNTSRLCVGGIITTELSHSFQSRAISVEISKPVISLLSLK